MTEVTKPRRGRPPKQTAPSVLLVRNVRTVGAFHAGRGVRIDPGDTDYCQADVAQIGIERGDLERVDG